MKKPGFKIHTANIWTDANAAASSINFDSRKNALKSIAKSNKFRKKYYEYHLAEGNKKQASLFKPMTGARFYNPANFQLRDFEETNHKSFPRHWEEITNEKCWKELEPALIEIGEYAFSILYGLNIEEGFELSINSNRDWYDKSWH